MLRDRSLGNRPVCFRSAGQRLLELTAKRLVACAYRKVRVPFENCKTWAEMKGRLPGQEEIPAISRMIRCHVHSVL